MTAFDSNRPLRAAVIGSGPSGFYAAEALLKHGDKNDLPVTVDIFDRLPTPFGLVRGGVAPDHPKIKKVAIKFEKLAARPEVSFLGNVNVGTDIDVSTLQEFFDAVIFTTGAESDRRLGIDGENLAGSHTATEFVGWYNGHPDFRDCNFDLSQEVVAIIGQGNVAMDVARILAKTREELQSTDIAEHALDALTQSRVKEIHLIGRRGPAQAKFTPPEIREMGELSDCGVVVDAAAMDLNDASRAELDDKDSKHLRENVETLTAYAKSSQSDKPRQCHIHFFESPKAVLGTERVEGLRLETNALEGEPFSQWSVGTGKTRELACGLVFRSVGYRGLPVKGLPFDEKKAVIPHHEGRILDGDKPLLGLYCAGWIKRGPSGVIGTNKPDAVESVQSLLADLDNLPRAKTRARDAVRTWLKERGVRVVTFADYKKIDDAEVAAGQAKGKPREKFTRVSEMLAAIDA